MEVPNKDGVGQSWQISANNLPYLKNVARKKQFLSKTNITRTALHGIAIFRSSAIAHNLQ